MSSDTNITNGITNGIHKDKDNPLEPKFVTDDDTPSEEPEVKEDDAPPVSFFKLYTYASGVDKIMMTIGLLGAVVTGLTTPANTILFGNLLDAMVSQGLHLAEQEGDAEALFIDWFLGEVQTFALLNMGLGFIMFFCSYLSTTLFNMAAYNQIFRIRSEFLRSVLNQDIGWYDINQSGEFASRMNEDLSKLEDGFGEKVVMFAHFMVGFLSSIILALVLGWQLALVAMISLPVTFISVGAVAIVTSKLAKQEMIEYAKAGSIAEEVFSAIRTVFAFSGEQKESDRYGNNLVAARTINIKKGFFGGLGFGLLWFFIYASYALSFWYGIGLVLEHNLLPEDERVYTPGIMFTVFFSVMMGGMNLGMSSPYIEAFGIAKGAAAKVFKIVENVPEINPIANTGLTPDKCNGNLLFRNVNFNYPSRPDVNVLTGINLDIKKGDTIALVGSSGCGKSTCIQLIQRFYDPLSGQILIDNNDVKDLNVNWLRSRIGVVGQEPVLFNSTIYENIRYGFELATNDEIEQAAKAANAHSFITRLPDGYNTMVGERGAQMSGGQKQRIAIARALVRNPDILLLDEATSALDMSSEAKVQVALEKASEGRTTIIVAHRLSTIRNADKIIVLNAGSVVEEGTHRSLMELKGHYYDLVRLQIGTTDHDDKLENNKIYEAVEDEDIQDIDIIATQSDDDNADLPPISIWRVMKWNQLEWPYIVIGSVCSLVIGAGMPLFSIIFGELVTVLSNPDPEYVRSQTDIYSLWFVIIGIATGLATFLQIWTYGIAGEYLTERVRRITFSQMLKQEIAWFDDKKNGTGTLCARLSTDAAAVQGATGQRIGTVLQSISTLIFAIGIGMFFEWRLGLLALAFTPFIFFASYLEIKQMEKQNLGNSNALEKSTKVAVEVVTNIRTVVSLGKEKMFLQTYMDLLEPSVRSAQRRTHYRGVVYGIARSLFFFAYSACMVYGGHLIATENLEIGTVFIVTQALIMGTISIANSIAFAPNFQKGLIAASKVQALLEREPLIQDPLVKTDDEKWQADGNVSYDSIKFFYPSRPSSKVLRGLNLNVGEGQTVALVGMSGCGKSTCIQLLVRFYDPESGTISIDGRNTTTVTLLDLRTKMGIVSQEPSLFARTIGDNIAYGDNTREVPKEEVIDAAKKANIHNFIASLPLGYDTKLGDKGTQLSGGQKQRVAIARALIRKPKILLLDEATSALDMESEKVVQEALDAASEGRTCITIAHRLTTIINSDLIVVIEKGEVVEQGNHKQLLAMKGLYYSLYSLQSGE